MIRPPLRPVPLASILPIGSRPQVVITMSVGQWDHLLAGVYESGGVLLELDDDEFPIAAYSKEDSCE